MKKKLIIMILVLVVLVAPACWLNGRQGVYMGDRFYVPRDNQDNSWTWSAGRGYSITLDRAGDGTACSVAQNGQESTVQLDWKEDYARLTFEDGEIIEGNWKGGELTAPDGMPLWVTMTDDMIRIVTGNELEPPVSRYTLAKSLCRMDRREMEQFAPVWLVFVGILMYGIGMLNILFPEQLAMLGQRWKYDSYELSDAGRFSAQLGGAIAMVGGVVFMYLPLFV